MTLTNLPNQHTMLRLAARKSFAVTVNFIDGVCDKPLNMEGATTRLAIGAQYPQTTVLLERAPALFNGQQGFARFDLQAADLDLPAGEYPYEIIVISDGYSVIAIRGIIDLEDTVDTFALGSTFSDPMEPRTLVAHVSNNSITVQPQFIPAPGLKGDAGPQGEPGDPFETVEVTYDGSGRILSVEVADRLTEYTYNPDDTIATDSRDGVTRDYNYTDGRVTSIVPR